MGAWEFAFSGWASWWTETAALILNVPRREEHSKCAMISAAFLVYRESATWSYACASLEWIYEVLRTSHRMMHWSCAGETCISLKLDFRK